MAKLLIVESPSKAKTIGNYLGKEYHVLASYGHIRNLLPKSQGVDTSDFAMKYEIGSRSKKYIDAISKAAKNSDEILLATDPDREGEAIAWHILEVLNAKKIIKGKKISRIIFGEITKSAIIDALSSPREIAQALVQAQQARQALDYLIGFNLSPLLWSKIRYGLSAGRVQSPALRLVQISFCGDFGVFFLLLFVALFFLQSSFCLGRSLHYCSDGLALFLISVIEEPRLDSAVINAVSPPL